MRWNNVAAGEPSAARWYVVARSSMWRRRLSSRSRQADAASSRARRRWQAARRRGELGRRSNGAAVFVLGDDASTIYSSFMLPEPVAAKDFDANYYRKLLES